MSQDFTTRLQLQLREAALRDERRSPLGRRLAGLRLGMPGPAATAALALALLLAGVVVALGGLRWGGEDTVAKPRVIGNVPLAENLGWLAPGFGSVWIADIDRQVLLRVDPATRRVQAEIRTGGDPNAPGGDPIVNTGAGAVWAIARAPSPDGGHRVLRIDPETNSVTAREELPARQAPIVFEIQVVDDRPWVLTTRGAIELDPATGRPGRFVAIDQPASEPGPPWTIIAEDQLWVLTRESRIDRYDLGTGRKASSLPVRLAGTWAIVPTPEGVLHAAQNGELALASAEDGRIVWRQQVGTRSTVPLVVGSTLWMHANGGAAGRDRLVDLDLRTGRLRSSTTLPEFGIAGMTLVGKDVWITSPAGNAMIVRP